MPAAPRHRCDLGVDEAAFFEDLPCSQEQGGARALSSRRPNLPDLWTPRRDVSLRHRYFVLCLTGTDEATPLLLALGTEVTSPG